MNRLKHDISALALSGLSSQCSTDTMASVVNPSCISSGTIFGDGFGSDTNSLTSRLTMAKVTAPTRYDHGFADK